MQEENGQNVGYIVIYSERHDSYDLFKDLKSRDDIQLCVPHLKNVNYNLTKVIRKIHLSGTISKKVNIPHKNIWYTPLDICIDENKQYYMIVVDWALAQIDIKKLKAIAEKNNVKSILLMVNSVCSDIIQYVQKEICSINWDAIFTFDDNDAEKYCFHKVGYCYYSKHDENELLKKYNKDSSDIYYTGTITTKRKSEILSVYERLRESDLKVEFHLYKVGKERVEVFPYKDEIDYFSPLRGLMPYDEILSSVIKTKTILEIVQVGQSGPTLRYYEAVCYNKKLLTNNPCIVNFPYYDSRYMKVFTKPEDIDTDWVREEIDVDYKYNNEFSPVFLLEQVKKVVG